MNQTARIIATLKKCLKAKDITYRQLARELSLSEASVKRLFSEQSFSLKRLEEICQFLNLSVHDLVQLSEKAKKLPSILTVEQETALADNPKLLVFFYLMRNGRNPESIVRHYKISTKESLKLLLELDRLKIIALYPDNRVVFLTEKNIDWRKNGPIRARYQQRIYQEFLDDSLDQQIFSLSFETGKISEGSREVMLKKINRLYKEYVELIEIDETLPNEKTIPTGLMINFRGWVFSLVNDFKR